MHDPSVIDLDQRSCDTNRCCDIQEPQNKDKIALFDPRPTGFWMEQSSRLDLQSHGSEIGWKHIPCFQTGESELESVQPDLLQIFSTHELAVLVAVGSDRLRAQVKPETPTLSQGTP